MNAANPNLNVFLKVFPIKVAVFVKQTKKSSYPHGVQPNVPTRSKGSFGVSWDHHVNYVLLAPKISPLHKFQITAYRSL